MSTHMDNTDPFSSLLKTACPVTFWIPVLPVAGTQTYEPPVALPHSSCRHRLLYTHPELLGTSLLHAHVCTWLLDHFTYSLA